MDGIFQLQAIRLLEVHQTTLENLETSLNMSQHHSHHHSHHLPPCKPPCLRSGGVRGFSRSRIPAKKNNSRPLCKFERFWKWTAWQLGQLLDKGFGLWPLNWSMTNHSENLNLLKFSKKSVIKTNKEYSWILLASSKAPLALSESENAWETDISYACAHGFGFPAFGLSTCTKQKKWKLHRFTGYNML